MRGYYPEVALGEITDVDDSGKQQTVSHYAFAGELHSEVYRPQVFGLSSRPPKGSTGVVVALGGERSRSVFLGGEHDDHRPKGLKEGEAKLYDAEKNSLYFARKNGVMLTTSKGDTKVETKEGKITVTAKGDIEVKTSGGKVTLSADGNLYVTASGNIYLGSSDGSGTSAVETVNGPSSKVFAAL
jgi:phage baseplate assembly protein V